MPLGDMDFIFSCLMYLSLEDKIRIPARTCNILYLCLRKTRAVRSHHFYDVIVFEKLLVQKDCLHENGEPAFFQIPQV